MTRIITAAILVGVALLSGCSSYSPKSDVKTKLDERMKKYPFFKIVEIKKCVKEEIVEGAHIFMFVIGYEAIENCYVTEDGPNTYTIERSSLKRPGGFESVFASSLKKGEKVYESATLQYNSNSKKLAEINFHSLNSSHPFGNLEFE